MTEALIFAAGVALTWLCYRNPPSQPTVHQTPTTRPRRGTPEPPWTLPATPLIALGSITAPCNGDLHAWLSATDDMPVTVSGRPRLVGEPDTCLVAT